MRISSEMKVGLFAVMVILVVAYITVRISDREAIQGEGYEVKVVIDSAEGLIRKTPVEVAGIQVGYISRLELVEGRRAMAVLRIDNRVRMAKDAVVAVRTKGFLGETYIDLIPGNLEKGELGPGDEITTTNPFVDLGKVAGGAQEFVDRLNKLSQKNEENINRILEGLAQFSEDISGILSEEKESLSETFQRVSSISRKIDEGRGTVGRLVNDEEIADNINQAARGVSETIGGINRFQFQFDYHLEYLGRTTDFKNYVGLNLRPRPDKYFRLEFVVDPSPSPNQTVTTTETTTGGVTTETISDERVVAMDDFRISAQLAKSFYDFTIRGGMIESRGGIGLDWQRGPLQVQFSAFDFRTNLNQRPHLKGMANLYMTRNLFLVGGLDDFISRQERPDWFVGAGFSLIDEDIKSLFTAVSLGATRGK
ncbi:MAG: MCE family protein [Deltaproteobacteria bacterium]|nr:MCE family protein [Deltaproteobacteria bacterium]